MDLLRGSGMVLHGTPGLFPERNTLMFWLQKGMKFIRHRNE